MNQRRVDNGVVDPDETQNAYARTRSHQLIAQAVAVGTECLSESR
jgi:hypothetical protein